MGDAGYDGPNQVPNYRPWTVGQFSYLFHFDKCNLVFLDGHVRGHAQRELGPENMDPAL